MGYETKLIIGHPCQVSKKLLREEKVTVEDDGEVWFKYVKDKKGNFVETNITETFFMVAAEIDLCNIGDSNLSKVLEVNKDKLREYYWYGSDGNTRISKDYYGDKPELSSIKDCIQALEKDVKNYDYRRFKWALALLKSMEEDSGLQVLWFGH